MQVSTLHTARPSHDFLLDYVMVGAGTFGEPASETFNAVLALELGLMFENICAVTLQMNGKIKFAIGP